LKDPSQPEWLLRFPMVKATLRAMDTVTAFMVKKFPEMNVQIDYYTIAGASKRGWTTWDVGAVDPERYVVQSSDSY
jgi:PhoPQ-activated pathogenicity-related protein